MRRGTGFNTSRRFTCKLGQWWTYAPERSKSRWQVTLISVSALMTLLYYDLEICRRLWRRCACRSAELARPIVWGSAGKHHGTIGFLVEPDMCSVAPRHRRSQSYRPGGRAICPVRNRGNLHDIGQTPDGDPVSLKGSTQSRRSSR